MVDRRTWRAAAVLLVILAGVSVSLLLRLPAPLVGRAAPDFSLPRLQDPARLLSASELAEHGPLLLNIWASWCVACRREHPLLLELARRHKIRVYGLNYRDNRENALRWLAYYGDPYQASAWDAAGTVATDYGVSGIPETFVLDGQGVIRYKHAGPLTQEIVREKILPLLGVRGP
jgi:cytochrome c biogenesis protein CcmG/thiol:disulfide interchange protein DsbE